jgi:hypothetical protein
MVSCSRCRLRGLPTVWTGRATEEIAVSDRLGDAYVRSAIPGLHRPADSGRPARRARCIGAIRATDLAVIGVDNEPLARFMSPSLSTIDQNHLLGSRPSWRDSYSAVLPARQRRRSNTRTRCRSSCASRPRQKGSRIRPVSSQASAVSIMGTRAEAGSLSCRVTPGHGADEVVGPRASH